MKIEKMREKKREYGYTYAQIADLSGVPLALYRRFLVVKPKAPGMTLSWRLNECLRRRW